MTSGHFHHSSTFVFSTNFISLFASRPAGGIYIYLFIIIKLFGLVCDRLGSPSDLVQSWGGSVTVACRVLRREVGLTGHSIILYMSAGARALTIALCPVRVYKWRETRVYIAWWAATWSVGLIYRACRVKDSNFMLQIYMMAYRICYWIMR